MRALALFVTSIAVACSGHEPHAPPDTTMHHTAGTDPDPSTGGSENSGTASADADTAIDETGGSETGMCSIGGEGCPCTATMGCDPGLTCLSNLCVDVDGGCPIGTMGCPCTPGGACDPGLQCISMTCVG